MNKLLTSMIGVVIAIVLAVTVFIPLVGDLGNTADKMDDTTYYNEPKSSTYVGAPVKVAALSGTNEIVWDGAELTLNDDVMDLSYTAARKVIIAGEQMYMTCQSGGWSLTSAGYLNGAESVSNRTITSTTADLSSMTISFDGTDATVSYVVADVTNTIEITQSWGFIPSSSGDYVAYPYTAVNQIYYTTELWAVSNSNGHMISYSLQDGSMINGISTTSTNTSEEIGDTGIYGAAVGANLVDDSISVNSTLGNPQRLFAYIAPDSVTYSAGDNDQFVSLLSILPILVVVGIIVSIVAVVASRYE